MIIRLVFLYQSKTTGNDKTLVRYDPVSVLHKSIAGRYPPVSVADGPITARCRFMQNASWEVCYSLIHLCRVNSSTLILCTSPFPTKACLVSFYYYHILEKFLYLTQIMYPDQTIQNVASDLGLHCLPVPLLWDAKHKWVNIHNSAKSNFHAE